MTPVDDPGQGEIVHCGASCQVGKFKECSYRKLILRVAATGVSGNL